MWKAAVALLPAVLLGGCSNMLLPTAQTDTTSFASFEEARAAVDALVPMQSDRQALERNGFDPARHPNTRMLTHADVVRRFLPSTLLRREDLDGGVLRCIEAGDACRGLEISAARVHKARKGNVLVDLFNFKRHTETTGWRFQALVLLVGDLVVYRSWGGRPTIHEVEEMRHPLGPFQSIEPAPASER